MRRAEPPSLVLCHWRRAGNREQGTGDEERGMRVGGRGNCQNGRRRPMAGNREAGLVACGSLLAACKIRDSAKARRSPLGRSEAVLGPASLFCFHVPRLACQAVMSKILSSLLRVRGAAGPEKQTEAIRTNGIANHGLASKPWHVNDPQDPRLPPVAEATRGT